jgi:hypothetical protein
MTRDEWIEALDRCGEDAARYRFLKSHPDQAFLIFRAVHLLGEDTQDMDTMVDNARS